MAYATITDQFKINMLQHILDDWADSAQHYYIGIGRSEDWNDSDRVVSITNTKSNEAKFRESLQSIKGVENISYVVPRIDWSSGTVYSAYDDTVIGHPATSFYVMTAENDVYVCLETGKNIVGAVVASIVKPTIKSSAPFKTSDGYVWKYIYSIDVIGIEKFLSGNFMPVKYLTELVGDYSNEDSDQFTIQTEAVPGQITGYVVVSEGTNYVSAPTVSIDGDGVGAGAVAKISNGKVVSIEIDSDGSGNLEMGAGYSYANINMTGGATARAVIGSKGGFGANPVVDLKSRALMFNSKLIGIEKQFINVKATTAEKMGFIGRSEGVAVQSIATLKYYNWKKI